MELIKTYNEENLFKTQFTTSGYFILVLLVLALIGLGERVLYDLGRTLAGPIGDFGYFNNSKVIVVHAVFVVGLLILSVVVNYIFGRKREKYAIALVPYFLTSIILAIQLAIQLGVYFTSHHNNLQFYLVMSLLVVVTSYGIFHIQNNFKKIRDTKETNSTGLLFIFVIVFALFAVLILSFDNKESKNLGPCGGYNGNYSKYGGCNKNIPLNDTRLQQNNSMNPYNYQNQQQEFIGNDSYPRIMYWEGKVNQHWDLGAQSWMTDLDGISGTNIDPISYCRKFYPNTMYIQPYKEETISTWRDAGNNNGYTMTTMSYLCVQPN